jgi:hypothetical protein
MGDELLSSWPLTVGTAQHHLTVQSGEYVGLQLYTLLRSSVRLTKVPWPSFYVKSLYATGHSVSPHLSPAEKKVMLMPKLYYDY